jgi:hypothetical protein
MQVRLRLLSICLVISLASCGGSGKGTELPAAKRTAPRAVPPVVLGNVRYSAPHTAMGTITAEDAGTHAVLWTQAIYHVRPKPELERDVQDVYIDSLRAENGLLLIRNEADAWFSLDPATRKVRKR